MYLAKTHCVVPHAVPLMQSVLLKPSKPFSALNIQFHSTIMEMNKPDSINLLKGLDRSTWLIRCKRKIHFVNKVQKKKKEPGYSQNEVNKLITIHYIPASMFCTASTSTPLHATSARKLEAVNNCTPHCCPTYTQTMRHYTRRIKITSTWDFQSLQPSEEQLGKLVQTQE